MPVSEPKPINAKADLSGQFFPPDAYADSPVHFYPQKANLVPTYVLDRLAQVHHREQNNSNVNNGQSDISNSLKNQHIKWDDEKEYQLFQKEPFIRSVDSSYSNLLKAVRMPEVYSPDRLDEVSSLESMRKLDEHWGGDERLRSALMGPSSSDGGYEDQKSSGFWSLLFSGSSKSALPEDRMRHRSQAGYWMMLDEKRELLLPALKRIFVTNPLVPLLLRILIFVFSVSALALACTIFVNSKKRYDGILVGQQPGTIMAIVVQCCAIVYVIYIAYDEYLGKPMGLRNPLDKMKLIMFDLLFIIFSSANLALSFNSITDDQWVCVVLRDPLYMNILHPTVASLCRRQKALTSFLFLVLCLWVLTFTISIVRVVDRVTVADSRTD